MHFIMQAVVVPKRPRAPPPRTSSEESLLDHIALGGVNGPVCGKNQGVVVWSSSMAHLRRTP